MHRDASLLSLHRSSLIPSLIGFLALSAGCGPGDSVDPEGWEEVEASWDSVEPVLRTYESTHILVTEEPVASTAVPGALINVWVSEGAVDAYLDLDAHPFPVGGTIVREVLDGEGVLQSLTMIEKRAAGFSDCGDLLFAKATADLEPVLTAEGEPLVGKATAECASCHLGQGSRQFLFGVGDEAP